MSLLPSLFSDWWEDQDRPYRLRDRHFGMTLSPEDPYDDSSTLDSGVLVLRPPRHYGRRFSPYKRNRAGKRSSNAQVARANRDQFQVNVDVQQFAPEEVSVKVVDKSVVVEAKHEEREDEHGWISRQFVRRYLVPSDCDVDQVSSRLSSDGVLTVSVPRKEHPKRKAERVIKIQRTGEPAFRDDGVLAESAGEKEGQSPQKKQEQEKHDSKEQHDRKKTVKTA